MALSALVGYEGGNLINGTGLGQSIADLLEKNEYTNAALDYNLTHGAGSGNTPLAASITVNKTAGLAALLKGAYDVVKKHKLDETDKNILIPYAIGTVFDSNHKSNGGSSGGWN